MSKSEKLKKELKDLEEKTVKAELEEQKEKISTGKNKQGLEIRLFRTAQSFNFEKNVGLKQLSYNSGYIQGRTDVKMYFDREINAVKVESNRTNILIPVTNIAYIEFFTEESKEAAVKARKALG